MPITITLWDDASSWNAFVAQVPNTHFQQSWEWGEIAPDLGGKAIRLGATRSGALVGAMQVFVNPIRGIDRTHLYVPRGPAMCRPDLEVFGPLVDACRLLGETERAVGIRIEPNVPKGSQEWVRQFRTLDFRPLYPPSQPRSAWMLDISPQPDELLAGMKSKTRYNIRLAARKGVEVFHASTEDMDEFFDVYRQTAERDDFFIQPRPVYEHMFEVFRRHDRFCMLVARHEGTLIAAVTLIVQGDTCWYMHGASSNEHRNLMATYLLQWHAILWARERGCSLYDFRAVPDLLREDQDMFGVYRFKEGFGGYQYTTLETYGQPYRPALFGLWQMYFSQRFAVMQRKRARAGLPARQFA